MEQLYSFSKLIDMWANDDMEEFFSWFRWHVDCYTDGYQIFLEKAKRMKWDICMAAIAYLNAYYDIRKQWFTVDSLYDGKLKKESKVSEANRIV